MTLALRLSTVGRDVFDGKGLGVSEGSGVAVNDSVGVREAVWVAVGLRGVAASGFEAIVAVRVGVVSGVGAIGVDVNWQATDVTIHKAKSIRFRLIE